MMNIFRFLRLEQERGRNDVHLLLYRRKTRKTSTRIYRRSSRRSIMNERLELFYMATLFYNGLAFLALYLASVFISSFILKEGLKITHPGITMLKLKHKVIIVIPGINIIVSFTYFTFSVSLHSL